MKCLTRICLCLLFLLASPVYASLPDYIADKTGSSFATPDRIFLSHRGDLRREATSNLTVSKVVKGDDQYVTNIWFFSTARKELIAHYKMTGTMRAEWLTTKIKVPTTDSIQVVAQLDDGSYIRGNKTVTNTLGVCCGQHGLIQKHVLLGHRIPPVEGKNTVQEQKHKDDFLGVDSYPDTGLNLFRDVGGYRHIHKSIFNEQKLPSEKKVNVSEMVDQHEYNYPAPADENQPFTIHTELSKTPWNEKTHLMKVAVHAHQKYQYPKKPIDLVFVVDKSASMMSRNKLPLFRDAMDKFVKHLDSNDTVTVISYYGGGIDESLPTTYMIDSEHRARVLDAIASMSHELIHPKKGLAMNMAYLIGSEYKYILKDPIHIVWLTDGNDISLAYDPEKTPAVLKKHVEYNTRLSIFAVGDNFKDEALLRKISKYGDGKYYRINTRLQARKALSQVIELNHTEVARQPKLNVRFNPEFVSQYRLLSQQENRTGYDILVDTADDADVVLPGHVRTGLYEVVLHDDIKEDAELARIKLDYKTALNSEDAQLVHEVTSNLIRQDIMSASDNFRQVVTTAGLGLWFKDRGFRKKRSLKDIRQWLKSPDKQRSNKKENEIDNMISHIQWMKFNYPYEVPYFLLEGTNSKHMEERGLLMKAPKMSETGIVPIEIAIDRDQYPKERIEKIWFFDLKNKGLLFSVTPEKDAMLHAFATRIKAKRINTYFAVARLSSGETIYARKRVNVNLGGSCGG